MNDGWLKSLLEKLPGSWQVGQGKALAFGHTAAADLPECTASRENEHRYIRGAAGVADREVVCEKDAANAWAWQDKGAAAAGTAYQPKDTTLTALAAYNTNGLIAQTAADTFAGRTITGTANKVTVTQGDGVAGNPTLTLPDAITLVTPTVSGLAGTGTRVVEASSTGLLSATGALGMTLINETTHSAATTNSVNNCFSATYENYVIEVSNIVTTGAFGLCMRMRLSGTDNAGATSYLYEILTVNTVPATGAFGSAGTTLIAITSAAATFSSGRFTLFVDRPFVAAATAINAFGHAHYVGAAAAHTYTGGGVHNVTTSYDGFTLLLSGAGNVSCTTRVYGLRNTP